jgi:Flp pilus assembly protein TadG
MVSRSNFNILNLFAYDLRANVAMTFALVALPLMVAVGWGVDYSLAASTRARLQSAVDAAVLAGVESSSSGTQAASITVANNVFKANAPKGAVGTFTFSGSGSLSGSATYSFSTSFGPFTGKTNLSLAVHAQAASHGSSVCMLLLDQSASPGLLLNSGASISAPNCEVDVKSTGNPAATFNSGTTLSASKICVQGSSVTNNGGTHPNLATGCATVSNPFVGKLPAPPSTTCSGTYAHGGTINGGTVNFSPGVYCGSLNFNGTTNVNFAPGVYVISGGGWNVDGGVWKGTGVTFYFADTSKIQFNSGMNVSLSAPTSGTYSGILFYEKDGLSLSQFVFDDSVGESLNGLIYLPSRQLTFNSNANLSSQQVTLVADTATFDTMNWNLSASSALSINNTSSGSVALTQ